jgi:hypothetical protein
MSRLDNLPNRLPDLPDSLIESLSEPKIHPLFSELYHNLPSISVNIIMSVALASTFIAVFFFTYVKNVERKIVVKNVKYLIDDLTETIIPFLPPNMKKFLYYQLDVVNLPNMSKEDNEVTENNHKLLIKSAKLFGITLVVLFTIAFIICKKYNIDFFENLITSFLLLVAIAGTEYLFLNYIIFNYISANPNKIKLALIKTVVNN